MTSGAGAGGGDALAQAFEAQRPAWPLQPP
jgi:hypothetical protein